MKLTETQFADLFGIETEELPDECREQIARHNFNYRVLSDSEHDQILGDINERIDNEEFSIAGPEGKSRWEKGWGENLKAYLAADHELAALAPKYFRNDLPLRLHQQYIMSEAHDFEANWYDIFRLWLFKTYLKDVDAIYEYGCGSGFNLGVLAELYPEKELHGLDWAEPSKRIVDEMRTVQGTNTWGHVFDFFDPDCSMRIKPNSAVITIGALEQTGDKHDKFLDYLLEFEVSLVVHVEPIVEWYDPENPIDQAAIRFHQKRHYWEGYVGRLEQLERDGRIRILKKKRSFFGSLYIEGFSQLIWQPVTQ